MYLPTTYLPVCLSVCLLSLTHWLSEMGWSVSVSVCLSVCLSVSFHSPIDCLWCLLSLTHWLSVMGWSVTATVWYSFFTTTATVSTPLDVKNASNPLPEQLRKLEPKQGHYYKTLHLKNTNFLPRSHIQRIVIKQQQQEHQSSFNVLLYAGCPLAQDKLFCWHIQQIPTDLHL